MFIKNKRSGFTLVEIMIVVAIIALLAAVGIPSLLNARRAANDSAVQANLKSIATEFETFAAQDAEGDYPVVADLTANSISARICITDGAGGDLSTGGFDYDCTLATTGYALAATPSNCGTSGAFDYAVTTGAVSATPVAC